MLNAEAPLLSAVVDALRISLNLDAHHCDVEYDADFVPQTAGDLYVAVSPEGLALGKNHSSSGGVYDITFGCRVTVYLRSRNTPRDKRRSLFLNQVGGINEVLDTIIRTIDWKPAVVNSAISDLRVREPQAKGFTHPLSLVGVDPKPRSVVGDVYGASVASAMGADTYVGLARGVTFGNARRMEVQP
jgi:hypothetical protein